MELTTVKKWMNDLVIYIDPDAPLTEALALMRRRYTNSLIVKKSDDNPDYGIVTSSDICDKIIAQGRNPAEVKTRDIMHSPLITATMDMSIQKCAQIMVSQHIHHLPVVDEEGRIVGMISATDFLVVAEGIANDFQDRSLS